MGAGTDVARDAVVYYYNNQDAELLLHLGCQCWKVSLYRADYSNSLDARRFEAMFSDGRNKAIIDRRGNQLDTDIDEWYRRWNAMNS